MRIAVVSVLGSAVLIALAATGATTTGAAATEVASLSSFRADRVVVIKSQRRLVLMRGDQVLKVYPVALGRYPKGHKIKSGDARTPEGSYTLDYRLDRSAFYKAIHISYPNRSDVARARFLGVPPGGKIMIHGLPSEWSAGQLNHPNLDWTQGCIAVTNREIDEIWAMVKDGTRIDIHP